MAWPEDDGDDVHPRDKVFFLMSFYEKLQTIMFKMELPI